jgi:hypothetical protein
VRDVHVGARLIEEAFVFLQFATELRFLLHRKRSLFRKARDLVRGQSL